MDIAFLITAAAILAGAAGAMAARNVVHCALCGVVAFASLAVAFLQLRAEFVGFAQLLVYVGAVAILIVVALLLTRNFEATHEALSFRPWALGLAIALLVSGAVVSAILGSGLSVGAPPSAPPPTVKAIGDLLMTRYVVALEAMGVLLTVALIGAALVALRENGPGRPAKPGEQGSVAGRLEE